MTTGLTPDTVAWMRQMFVQEAPAFSELVDSMPLPPDLADTIARVTSPQNVAGDVLDLCCGNGRLTSILAPRARSLTGLDFSAPLITIARERYGDRPHVRFVLGDASQLRQSVSGGFDLIVRLYTSLGYFDRPTEVSILSECAAVANRDAHILLDSFNGEWFAQRGDIDRRRVFGQFELHENYCYQPSSGTVQCSWSSPQFAAPILFSLHLHDRTSSERLLVDAGWSEVRHYVAYSGEMIRDDIPERMLISAKKAS
jgi:ubiquinone/menaquinone biosynthesis C-methylase UbiE